MKLFNFIFVAKKGAFLMLRQLISGNMSQYYIIQLLLLVPIILLSLSVHEFCHGYAAMKLGDDTAKNMGRLTLNPLKHLDPFGFIMLLLLGFGYAKPVPVNARYMKNAKWGFVIVSLAGPLSNLLLAFICALFGQLFYALSTYIPATAPAFIQIATIITSLFFALAVQLNVGYAVFNMIPIPPLDGSRLLTACLPRSWAIFSFRYERYFQYALLILLYLGAFTGVISTCVSAVSGFIYDVVGLIPFELLYK